MSVRCTLVVIHQERGAPSVTAPVKESQEMKAAYWGTA